MDSEVYEIMKDCPNKNGKASLVAYWIFMGIAFFGLLLIAVGFGFGIFAFLRDNDTVSEGLGAVFSLIAYVVFGMIITTFGSVISLPIAIGRYKKQLVKTKSAKVFIILPIVLLIVMLVMLLSIVL